MKLASFHRQIKIALFSVITSCIIKVKALNIYVCFVQVKEIEKRDSTLTSSQQLDRLTRPGATYFNLNPYDVSID